MYPVVNLQHLLYILHSLPNDIFSYKHSTFNSAFAKGGKIVTLLTTLFDSYRQTYKNEYGSALD